MLIVRVCYFYNYCFLVAVRNDAVFATISCLESSGEQLKLQRTSQHKEILFVYHVELAKKTESTISYKGRKLNSNLKAALKRKYS